MPLLPQEMTTADRSLTAVVEVESSNSPVRLKGDEMTASAVARRAIVFAAISIAIVLMSGPGQAESTDGVSRARAALAKSRAEQDRLRRQRLAVARKTDGVRVTRTRAATALRTLTAELQRQSARVDAARREMLRAQEQQQQAARDVERIRGELATLSKRRLAQGVLAYVGGLQTSPLWESASAADPERQSFYRSWALGYSVTLQDELRARREDLQLALADTRRSAERTKERRDRLGTGLRALQRSSAEQRTYLASLESRLEASLSEAASIRRLDERVAARLETEQNSLVGLVRSADAKRRAAEARAKIARAAAVAGLPTTTPRTSDVTPTIPDDETPSPALPRIVVPTVERASVRGLTVNAALASNIDALLAAADADGLALSGAGYRNSTDQVALRRAHCGASSYALYEMPASSCRPPTARPGASMHERGLAIDFTDGGRLLSRGSRGFAWLVDNAARFGLQNLPSEPWHWSTNGN